ncbi:hypothetical protein B9T10_07915 [Wohlfahrtiimonas chitiniclastica]|uniref:hypothetical protein n=1 Tax=Wohlfahrtiimonas chitiniclastica TaxID=400946 RepID=UPI000B98E8A2|nr:hypothetical protein [Wohlfahrtiimonas chitiniclastica]OYQ87977.1 hypothetical protein B9T10_07915 [Wohlfahrtiimonas chitiniclastica]
MNNIDQLEQEFWYHVSTQEDLPLAALKTKDPQQNKIDEICQNTPKDILKIPEFLTKIIQNDPNVISQLRMLASISDKRFYLEMSYIFSRVFVEIDDNLQTLCGCPPEELTKHSTQFFINLIKKDSPLKSKAATDLITKYLCKHGLDKILLLYANLTASERTIIMETLIFPKEIQQQEAKLRGHGAEKVLAELLVHLGVSFFPENKADQPMAKHDPNIDNTTMIITDRNKDNTFSSDLVILNNSSEPIISIVGLIHSSDPGQFGVDKANTVKDIRNLIDLFNNKATNRRMQIWGLVDGVGYSENKKGTINAMLPHFHQFIQVKTLWKAALALHTAGLCNIKGIMLDKKFYIDPKIISHMISYIPKDIQIYQYDEHRYKKGIPAGTASLYL